jgi:hypothetical protein
MFEKLAEETCLPKLFAPASGTKEYVNYYLYSDLKDLHVFLDYQFKQYNIRYILQKNIIINFGSSNF